MGHDLEGMARVARASSIAIGFDEGLHRIDDLRRHHEARAARGVSLKTIKLGGLRPVCEAARVCCELEMKVNLAGKMAESGIATAAVLVVGDAAAGIDAAAVVFYRRNSLTARLYSLAVAMHARGAGLGRTLLAASEADARVRGCESMRLEVRVDNAPAIALYERHGYVRGSRIPGFYEDGADAWRYLKRLTTVSHE